MSSENQINLCQTSDGKIELEVAVERDTVWLRQEQMSELFGRERSVITKHLRNIFAESELEEKSNVQNMHIAGSDKPVKFYNLDVIISVGYRVKSIQGTRFRQWATSVLRQHLVQGYTLHKARFEKNATELEQALTLIRKTAQSPELTREAGSGLVEIVSRYTQTFLWLQRYDEGMPNDPSGESGGTLPSATDAAKSIEALKQSLITRGDGLAALLGNLDQTAFGEPAYPTIESKAAHLLYFVVKNHPFTDGNKRSGAFLFVDFLHRNGRLLNKRAADY
ncbi:MAG: virulence-related protein [Verrucomicrobiaceae bacterium]|nr:virulence-related protein [Verrucomicrobiaceae bacterium]